MLLQSLQARKEVKNNLPHIKKNKEISEAMDEAFPIYNTLPQTFLM
jgi:hypothetical protein